MPERLDGVTCEPGDIIFSDDGTVWYCNDVSHQYQKAGEKVMPKIPDCGPREVLAWNADRNVFECITDDPRAGVEVPVVKPIDPLWIIFWVAVVFVLGSLGVGLTQWWRNRRAKRAAEKVAAQPPKSWQDLMSMNFPKSDLDKVQLGVTPKGDITVAEPIDKNPDSLQDEIKEIYSLIQLARNDINKITGFMQLCITPAMENLNKARDRVAALGGKVK